jgi:hypothetical protein
MRQRDSDRSPLAREDQSQRIASCDVSRPHLIANDRQRAEPERNPHAERINSHRVGSAAIFSTMNSRSLRVICSSANRGGLLGCRYSWPSSRQTVCQMTIHQALVGSASDQNSQKEQSGALPATQIAGVRFPTQTDRSLEFARPAAHAPFQ